MTDKTQNPAEIFLVEVFDGEDYSNVWCDTPAPGEGMREEDATRYVRADLVPDGNQVLAHSIAELTRKNSELMAKVEQLKHRAIDLLNADDIEDDEDRVTIHANMNDAVLATPDQCLIERDIEVANAAFMHAINLVRQRPERANHAVFISQKWGECETQMRQQAKAGSNG